MLTIIYKDYASDPFCFEKESHFSLRCRHPLVTDQINEISSAFPLSLNIIKAHSMGLRSCFCLYQCFLSFPNADFRGGVKHVLQLLFPFHWQTPCLHLHVHNLICLGKRTLLPNSGFSIRGKWVINNIHISLRLITWGKKSPSRHLNQSLAVTSSWHWSPFTPTLLRRRPQVLVIGVFH